MKIDNLINEVKTTTKYLIVVTNKSTIDSFFKDINNKVDSNFGVFYNLEPNNTKDIKRVQSIFRGGVTVHFIDQKDIDENIFY